MATSPGPVNRKSKSSPSALLQGTMTRPAPPLAYNALPTSGPHSSNPACPKWEEECRIRKVRTVKKLSYKEALQQLKTRAPAKRTTAPTKTPASDTTADMTPVPDKTPKEPQDLNMDEAFLLQPAQDPPPHCQKNFLSRINGRKTIHRNKVSSPTERAATSQKLVLSSSLQQ